MTDVNHAQSDYGPLSTQRSDAAEALDHGGGVLRLAPAWVPRAFCVPGRRLKLHDRDYFALGGARGGIDERWLGSATRADNGPLTGEHEGESLVLGPGGTFLPLSSVVQDLGSELIGERLWDTFGAWTVYSKFFDNAGPLPFHVHHSDELAARVGRRGKPEAYYFPPELNNHTGSMPVSYFGLRPGTAQSEFLERLRRFGQDGDNRVTELSLGYRLELGTGWDIPPGVLHAPGSVLTYEPQAASDVFAMCESWTSCRTLSDDLLWKDVPERERGNFDYILEILDWELNIDPHFAQNRFMRPFDATRVDEFHEEWIVYRSSAFSAKRLTVPPGRVATVRDLAAYGAICVQGRGRFGHWPVEAPTTIRFGQLTNDEFFVSEEAAGRGIRIVNESDTQDLVILKHFGPGNPENTAANASS
jgi:hypothetical protein